MRFLEFLAVSALASASAFAEPSAATRFRGVMLAGNVDAIQEDDFATLETWGANLVRFQTPRGWSKPRYWESNDDYDAYIGHALDILQDKVLPWADAHGQKVVMDLHATPGSRNEDKENLIFHEKRYADHFVETWRRIAERFKGDRRLYGYDLMNEPLLNAKDAPYSVMGLQLEAARAIRAIDPDATIGAETYLRDCIDLFEEYGWDWSYHAFREWDGWSVEKTWTGREGDRDIFVPDPDTPRKRALLDGFAR